MLQRDGIKMCNVMISQTPPQNPNVIVTIGSIEDYTVSTLRESTCVIFFKNRFVFTFLTSLGREKCWHELNLNH